MMTSEAFAPMASIASFYGMDLDTLKSFELDLSYRPQEGLDQ